MTPEQEELLKMQLRMSAMQAAIAFYCCHKGKGSGSHGPGEPGEEYGEHVNLLEALREVMDRLISIRNMLLEVTMYPDSSPI